MATAGLAPALEWHDNAAIRLLVAGPWLTYTLDQLVWLAGLNEIRLPLTLGLIACSLGVVASVCAIARWRHTRTLALAATALFFAVYVADIALWIMENRRLHPALIGDSYLSQVESYYRGTWSPIASEFHSGHLAEGIALAYRTVIMPVFQLAVIALFVMTLRSPPAGTALGRQSGLRRRYRTR